MRLVVLAAIVAGCAGRSEPVRFVRDARLDGYTLVLTKCWVRAEGDQLFTGACVDTRSTIPVLVGPATPPSSTTPPGLTPSTVSPAPQPLDPLPISDRPEPSALIHAIAPLRDALTACAAANHVSGVARVRLKIDPAGKATAVVPETGGTDFAACLTRTVGAVTFPASRDGGTLTFAVRGVSQ